MQKRVGLISMLALGLVIYLIWQDPNGSADMVSGFFDAIGGFVATLWEKLGEFFTSLFGS